MFILPASVLNDIEKIIRGFLWCQGPMKAGKAKVAWEDICLPKWEGGLGIKRLNDWNISLMTTHLWSIITKKDSIWVRWVYAYKLGDRNFWDISPQSCMSWGWRKVLQIRDLIRPFCWYKIGDGRSTSVWYDTWDIQCPIARVFTSNRDITRPGFTTMDTVADLMEDASWKWPSFWLQKYPFLSHIVVPSLTLYPDKLMWRNSDGVFSDFSVAAVWDSIRPRGPMVDWARVVWFSHCIPRHAFYLWLVFKRKLKTQDRLRQWDVGPSVNLNLLRCFLCGSCPDSHAHLFFECSFSSQVWFRVSSFADLQIASDNFEDIKPFFSSAIGLKNIDHVVSRLVLAATVYFLWQERNFRLFSKGSRSAIEVSDVIINTIRLKMVSFTFKPTYRTLRTMERWKLPRRLCYS